MNPAGKQDICRLRTGVWNEAGGFSPGTKSGSLGSNENHIMKRVMTGNTIPAATTSHLMVTIDVSLTATLRTLVGSPMEGHPQPVPKKAAELLVMEVPEGRGKLGEQRLTSHSHGIGQLGVSMAWIECLGQRRGASVQQLQQWLGRVVFGGRGHQPHQVGPIWTDRSRSKSCNSKMCVRRRSQGVLKYPLHQWLDLCPGAQQGSRGMGEELLRQRLRLQLGSDAFSQDQGGTVPARMASSYSRM